MSDERPPAPERSALLDFYRSVACVAVQAAARAAAVLPELTKADALRVGPRPSPSALRLFGGGAWARLALPFGLLHPACQPAVADRLGWTPLQVHLVATEQAWVEGGACRLPPGHPGHDLAIELSCWPPNRPLADSEVAGAVARWRALGLDADVLLADDAAWMDAALEATGLSALEELVGSELLVTDVPVPPPDVTPWRGQPGIVVAPRAVTAALASLLEAAQRARWLVDQGLPSPLLRAQRRLLQDVLERAVLSWGEDGLPPGRALDVDPLPPAAPAPGDTVAEGDDSAEVQGVCILGDELVLDLPATSLRVDGAGVAASWPSPGARLVGASGSTLLYREDGTGAPRYFDLERGAWLDRHPADALLVEERREQVFLVDLAARRRYHLDEAGGYLSAVAYAPGAQAIAVVGEGGGVTVYGGHGECFGTFAASELYPLEMTVLRADGTTFATDDPTEWLDSVALAVGVWHGQVRWIAEGSLWSGGRHVCAFGFPVLGAAFSPDGRRAALVTPDALVWIDADVARVLESRPLPRPGG